MYPVIKRVAKKIKRELNVPIIVGGIHATALPEVLIKEDCFDMLCIGEGEEAMAELLEKMEKKEDIHKININ